MNIRSNHMIKTLFESQDQVLYSTQPTLSTILTQSSTTLQTLQNYNKSHYNGYTKLN